MHRSRAIVLSLILALIGFGVVASQSTRETPLQSLQPLTAAPDQHKLRFENRYVRVLEVIIPPGGIAPPHLHDLPSVLILLSPANLRLRDPDGATTRETSRAYIPPDATSIVRWLGPGSAPRSVENIDDVAFHGFRIELKALFGK